MIIIKGEDYEIPFVKEVMVQSVTKAGMKPWQAYSVVSEIRDELLAKGIVEISSDDLSDLVYNKLKAANPKVADRYKAWRDLKTGEREPLIILLGGGTGVGTTTVGTEVAYRVGIRNIIATDSIREIMRKTVSEKLLPYLHASSYDAYKYVKVPISKEKDKDLVSFQLQTWAVSVGIEAVIERALKEGTPTLVEGLYVVPGFLSEEILKKPNVLLFVLHLKDEKEHRNRFYTRAFETKFKRTVDGYVENFETIRKIQEYIKGKAKEMNTPIIENTDVERTVTEIMDQSIEAMIKESKKTEEKE
ncbi:MAG: 2-phosphoglycerate kinase [Candidatus Altiarchaeota archaeon]|nr:2-phosphoglycerate kinase [Candidatus Altiarchaeota archaeon]